MSDVVHLPINEQRAESAVAEPRTSNCIPRRRRVLIVVSSFDPCMVADMHRARLLAQELPALGWDVEILTPEASYHRPELIEPEPAPFFAREAPVHRVRQWHPEVFRRLSINGVGQRSFWPMYREGARLLASGRFDLVYISTTLFVLFCLGRLWQSRLGVPYVLDFHDPWIRPDSKYQTASNTFKWRAARLLSRVLEPFAVRRAAGVVAVSPSYVRQLNERYRGEQLPWQSPGMNIAIPFAANERDMPAAGTAAAREPDDRLRVVYVGGGGPIMAEAMRTLCGALAKLQASSEPARRVRIELYGTTAFWRPGQPRYLQQIAEAGGVGHLVCEQPGRRTYRESLELAASADALLVLGVDDEGYVPSKLFNYLLTGKPVLACFHHRSPAIEVMARPAMGAHLLRFGANEPEDGQLAVVQAFLDATAAGQRVDRRDVLQEFLAPAMAARHVELFERCLACAAGAQPAQRQLLCSGMRSPK